MRPGVDGRENASHILQNALGQAGYGILGLVNDLGAMRCIIHAVRLNENFQVTE